MEALTTFLNLHQSYDRFRENRLPHRFFNCSDVTALIGDLQKNPLFDVTDAGSSFERRPINLVSTGCGPIKVMLWSQMHGDEPTATMALFDLVNFLSGQDEFDAVRELILESCTLYLIPMLNPDGAERFTRRNAQGIDINRDFRHQQSPEGRLLRQLRDTLQPDFGFNLHDQTIRWSAGTSGNPATISLLAPAADPQRSINSVRKNAMQVCAALHTLLGQLLPGHTGRFHDEYEPRSFGDNFQAAGTATVLIEAGGYPGDPEKQIARQLTFTSLVYSLHSIAGGSWHQAALENYTSIPENKLKHVSILIKNCTVHDKNDSYQTDLGLVLEPALPQVGLSGAADFSLQAGLYKLEEQGDLTGFFGYEEIDATHLSLLLTTPPQPGKPANLVLKNGDELIFSVENGIITHKTGNL